MDLKISFSATSPVLSHRHRFPYFYRTVYSDEAANDPKIALLHYFRWKKVGIMYQLEDVFSEVR